MPGSPAPRPRIEPRPEAVAAAMAAPPLTARQREGLRAIAAGARKAKALAEAAKTTAA